ncbi:MAG: sodium:proton antiporter NhaD [Bacteroidales bacterium]|nr:sodium:proton antiporter NhaD [Bacteroidales bacterium]
MFVSMIIVFIIGYAAIAREHNIKIDKAATALILGAFMWILLVFGSNTIVPADDYPNKKEWVEFQEKNAGKYPEDEMIGNFLFKSMSIHHLGEASETLFFLLGAMTIVAIVEKHNGFKIITDKITTRNKRLLLWMLSGITFIMSALLDNLTTTIVMVTLLNKLVADKHLRWIYAGMIIIAANAGGAWSPIGDVTTIMLWINNYITTENVMKMLFFPSIISMVVPLAILGFTLKGELEKPTEDPELLKSAPESRMKSFCLYWGIGSLVMVPILKATLHLPPYLGIIGMLGIFWLITDIVHHHKGDHRDNSVAKVLSGVDVPTILFFLGILSAVAALQTAGHLAGMAQWLDNTFNRNTYGIGMTIGILSSIVDNVPLVAGAMGMYDLTTPEMLANGGPVDMVQDGTFWQLLAYCAGTGGSILIVGSAAGVAAMGLEKIEFGWYFKHISWLALLGYLAGALCFWLMHTAFA